MDNLNNVVFNDSFDLEFNGIHFRNENNHLLVDGLIDAIGEIKIENENLILGVSRKW